MLAGAALAAAQPAARPLAVVQSRIHLEREDGPPIPANYAFIGGQPLYLSFRVANFKVVKDTVDLRYQIVLTDPEGVLLTPPATGSVAAEVSDNDKDWLPVVRETLVLPPLTAPGECLLKIRVADEHAKASAEEVLRFRTQGLEIAPAEKLTVRDFRFFRSENDAAPADPPAFAAGAPVFARFVLTGYRLGEKNRFDISYGIRVLRPDGSVLFSQPDAAAESDAPFYPKRYLVGGMGLTLSADVPKGEYTVALSVQDKVGPQALEERFHFRIE